MSTTTAALPPEYDASSSTTGAQSDTMERRARIDGPHASALEVVEEPSDDLIAAVTGQLPDARREQLELQAAQLSEHLRERLREVDRREAQLNARAAQHEADLRSSRVWLGEREHELAEREATLRRQFEDAATEIDAEGDADALPARREELLERESQLQRKENEVRERRFDVERQAAALRHSQQLWEQERSRQEAELDRERQRLTRDIQEQTTGRDVASRTAEQALIRDRAELQADRAAWEERRQVQTRALDERIAAAEAQIADRGQRLDGRADWIERQKISLEQVRGEVSAQHRQSLEMRLVAEQLWSQINGRTTPAEVTQSIAHLRRKLAEHYRLEEEALATKKTELLELGQRVTDRHRELTQLQSGLKQWVDARQDEIEQQAARLVQRELNLDEQQAAAGQLSGSLREVSAAA